MLPKLAIMKVHKFITINNAIKNTSNISKTIKHPNLNISLYLFLNFP